MKGLLVSDVHYRLKQLDWLAAVAPAYDLVVIAGDHLDVASSVAIEAQVSVTLKYLERVAAATKLIVSSGNHDLNSRGAEGEKIAKWMSKVRRLGIPADGESLRIGDALFTVCPWWTGRRQRRPSPVSSPPTPRTGEAAGSGSTTPRRADRRRAGNGTRHYGDDDLVGWIAEYAPDLVLCGHIHQSPFRDGGSWIVAGERRPGRFPRLGIERHVRRDRADLAAGVEHPRRSQAIERARLDVDRPTREPIGR